MAYSEPTPVTGCLYPKATSKTLCNSDGDLASPQVFRVYKRLQCRTRLGPFRPHGRYHGAPMLSFRPTPLRKWGASHGPRSPAAGTPGCCARRSRPDPGRCSGSHGWYSGAPRGLGSSSAPDLGNACGIACVPASARRCGGPGWCGAPPWHRRRVSHQPGPPHLQVEAGTQTIP